MSDWPSLHEGNAQALIEYCELNKFYLSDFYVKDLVSFPIIAFGVEDSLLRLRFSRPLTPGEIWQLAMLAGSDNDLSHCVEHATEIVLWFD